MLRVLKILQKKDFRIKNVSTLYISDVMSLPEMSHPCCRLPTRSDSDLSSLFPV